MSMMKMTDILVSTRAFFVTFTYPSRGKSDEWSAEDQKKALIEVTPIISSEFKDISLTKDLYQILTSEPGSVNKHAKDEVLHRFVQRCPKHLFEEFWESARSAPLEKMPVHVESITCILYSTDAEIVAIKDTLPIHLIMAMKALEETFFAYAMDTKNPPVSKDDSTKKEWKKDNNRKTHKYFLHHRGS
jgi:hypothetical protein